MWLMSQPVTIVKLRGLHRWLLERRLRAVRKLYDAGVLVPTQYAALAIRVAYRLEKLELRSGMTVRWDRAAWPSAVLIADRTRRRSSDPGDYSPTPDWESFGALADWLGTRGHDQQRDTFVWTQQAEGAADRAALLVNPLGRAALAVEAWAARQRSLFPILSGWVERAIIWALGFLVGYLVGHR